MTAFDQHLQRIEHSRSNHTGIAFFDLDRTLISGYSILALALETARFGLQKGELRQPAKVALDAFRKRVDHSNGNYERLVRRLAKTLTGVTESTLRQLGDQAYENTLAKSLYREAISLIEAHRAKGHKVVIISAASDYQVEPIAWVLGVDDICCTHLEVQEGRFTGQVVAPLCFGEGKLLAAQRIARQYDTDLNNSWFYSDSIDDMPLLSKVAYPVATNPSDNLKTEARNRGWPMLNFTTRGMPNIECVVRTALTLETLVATTAWGMLSEKLGMESTRTANTVTRLVGDVGCTLAGLDFDIDGIEHLHKNRPAIFVFNHQSMLDTLVLAHLLRRDAVAYCKSEMNKVPIIGPLLRQADTIFVDRGDANQKDVLHKSLDVLRKGKSLVIAPEGTRSTLGDIQPFKQGAFLLAKRAKVPIIPIVLHNVKDAMPKGGLLIRPAHIKVSVLEPIAADSIGSIKQACAELEQRYIDVIGHSEQTCLPKGLNAVA